MSKMIEIEILDEGYLLTIGQRKTALEKLDSVIWEVVFQFLSAQQGSLTSEVEVSRFLKELVKEVE